MGVELGNGSNKTIVQNMKLIVSLFSLVLAVLFGHDVFGQRKDDKKTHNMESAFSFKPHQPRPIRFVEVFLFGEWRIKIYSISINQEYASADNINAAKAKLGEWLLRSKDYSMPTYGIATLIIHEYRDGCFAVLNWWIDENMWQNFVYLKPKDKNEFKIYSQNGMATCVWEMAIWWHERNAWMKHVLLKNEKPDFEGYLKEQINQDI